jgi:hypothetical protein
MYLLFGNGSELHLIAELQEILIINFPSQTNCHNKHKVIYYQCLSILLSARHLQKSIVMNVAFELITNYLEFVN